MLRFWYGVTILRILPVEAVAGSHNQQETFIWHNTNSIHDMTLDARAILVGKVEARKLEDWAKEEGALIFQPIRAATACYFVKPLLHREKS